MVVDEEKVERCHLRWARILIKSSGRKVLVVDREVVLAVQLRWEHLRWLMLVVSKGCSRDPYVMDECVVSAYAVRRVELEDEKCVSKELQALG